VFSFIEVKPYLDPSSTVVSFLEVKNDVFGLLSRI